MRPSLGAATALACLAAGVCVADPAGARLYVSRAGLVRFPLVRLEALGVELERLDPSGLRLSLRGQVVPLRLERGGGPRAQDVIEFLAQLPRGESADYDVYLLDWDRGGGLWMPTLPELEPGQATALEHSESELELKAPETILLAPRRHELRFESPAGFDANRPARIELELRGVSTLPADPDHHLVVSLNGEPLGELRWDGEQTAHFVSPESSRLYLVPRNNRLELWLPGDLPDAKAGQPAVDGVRVVRARMIYEGALAPRPGGRTFVTPAITVDRWLYRVGNAGSRDLWFYSAYGYRLRGRKLSDGSVGAVDFGWPAAQVTMVEQGDGAEPDYIELVPAEADPRGPADYLVIAPAALFPAAQELAELRSGRGLRARAVRAEQLYDLYSDSFPEVAALRAYLLELRRQFPPGPRYLVLLGDARKDFRKWSSASSRVLIPTTSIEVSSDEINASDARIVDLEGDDGIPEISVGRLPARSLAEAERLVAKIRAYEQAPIQGRWLARSLFVTGLPKAGAEVNPFMRRSQELILAELPGGFRPEKLFLERSVVRDPRFVTDRVPDPAATKRILELFNDGLGIVHYSGHGGMNVWEDRQLLTLEDVPRLTNRERLPLVISMSCFTAYFDDTDLGCIGEELVNAAGGAIAFWGSTGRSSMQGNFRLSELVFQALFEPEIETVGQLFDAVKARFLDAGGPRDMADAYVLLGDPALRLALPRPTLELVSAASQDGGPLRFEARPAVLTGGRGELILEDAAGAVVREIGLTPGDRRFEGSVERAGLSPGRYQARAIVWDGPGRTAEVGSIEVFVGVSEIAIEPPPRRPFRDQPVVFAARVRGTVPPESVVLRWTIDRQQWRDVPMDPAADGRYVARAGIVPPAARSSVVYKVAVHEPGGAELETAERSLRFLERADLAVRPQVGVAGAPWAAILRNTGDVPLTEVEVGIQVERVDGSTAELARRSLAQIGPRSQMPIPLHDLDLGAARALVVIADPANRIEEPREHDNDLRLELGARAATLPWTVRRPGGGAVPDFRLLPAQAPAPRQTGLTPAVAEHWAVQLEAAGTSGPGPIELQFTAATPDSRLAIWEQLHGLWLLLAPPASSTATVPGGGIYGALRASRSSQPRVELLDDPQSGRRWALVFDPDGLDLALHPPSFERDRSAAFYAPWNGGRSALVAIDPPDAKTLVITGFDGVRHSYSLDR